jgi:hypothetical protein
LRPRPLLSKPVPRRPMATMSGWEATTAGMAGHMCGFPVVGTCRHKGIRFGWLRDGFIDTAAMYLLRAAGGSHAGVSKSSDAVAENS